MAKQFGRNPEILDATGFSGDGSLLTFGQQVIEARATGPNDPPADHSIVWVDNTTDELKIKITDGGGTTRTYVLAPDRNTYSPFDELRTYQRTLIIDLKSIYGLSDLRDVQTIAGSGSISHSTGEYRLQTTASGTDSATLDSAERGRYLAGQGSEIGIGVRVSDTPTGSQDARWGYFDDNNGYGFGVDATGFYVFDRTGGTETKVRPANFTNDAMDGTGPSGYTLSLADAHIFQAEFSWYGYGTINYKVVAFDTTTKEQKTYVMHRLRKTGSVSIEDPNLPIRASIANGGTANAFDSLYVAGRQYSTLGIYKPNRRITSEYRLSLGSISTTFLPLISFRRKSAFESVGCKVDSFDIITDQDLLVQLRTNVTPTGGSYGTPTDHTAGETALEVNNGATAIGTGDIVWEGLVDASGSGGNSSGFGTKDVLPQDLIGTQPMTLCARRVSTDATASVVFRIAEEW